VSEGAAEEVVPFPLSAGEVNHWQRHFRWPLQLGMQVSFPPPLPPL
jgi:hypothetical protein